MGGGGIYSYLSTVFFVSLTCTLRSWLVSPDRQEEISLKSAGLNLSPDIIRAKNFIYVHLIYDTNTNVNVHCHCDPSIHYNKRERGETCYKGLVDTIIENLKLLRR